MIRPQFSAYLDPDANVHIASGVLIDLSASPTEMHWMESGDGIAIPNLDGNFRRAIGSGGTFFMGGNGRNVNVTGTVSGMVIGSGSGAYTVKPTGIFVQSRASEWRSNYMVMTFDAGAGTAEISDDTDVIATMATSASPDAPDGTFSSTSYGATNYNGGTSFSLTAAFEDRILWPSATVATNVTTTIETGGYTGTAWGEWEADTDPSWTITTAADGTAELSDGTDIVATRASGIDGDPSGIYQSTNYGAANYASVPSFIVDVGRIPIPAPMSGVWYCTVETSGGSGSGPGGGHTVDDFTGPHFATTLPSNSTSATHYPICQSNGTAFWQVLEGAIHWH